MNLAVTQKESELMAEMTTIATAELSNLEERVKKLAADKSTLQLIIQLMNKLNTAPGLDNTVETMLRSVSDVVGGVNLSLYYLIDHHIHYADVYGHKQSLETLTDGLVKKVFETREPLEVEHEFSDTRIIAPEFSQAYTWVVPLLVGSELVGVFKMESLNIAMREMSQQLPTFFSYAALVLKNEIMGHTRLKQAYDDLAQEMTVRQQAEAELRQANELLEERVADRTGELQTANEQLRRERVLLSRITETSPLGTVQDITERKQAEEALRDSERRLAEAQRIAHIGYWERDFEAGRILLSDEACRIFGLSPQEVPFSLEQWHQRWLELIHPQDQPRAAQAAIDAVGNGPPYNVEYRVVRPGGEVRFIHSEANVKRDESGRPRFMLGMMQDITERKRAEEALRESEKRYRIVADNTYDWEFWLNPDEQFLYNSPSCQRITGYTAEDFAREPDLLNRIIHPEDYERFMLHHQQVMEKKAPGEVEFRILRADGSVRYIGHVCQPVFDEQGSYLGKRGSNRDITERKHAEEALRASEERYRTLVEQAADGIFIADANGNYVDVNPSGCRMLGYSREQILKLNMRDLVPAPQQKATPLHFTEMRSGKTVLSQRNLIRQDGSLLSAEISGIMLVDGRFMGFVRDVTERKRAEEELARYRNQLEELVTERTHQLLQSEEHYRRLFETMLQGVVYQDADGKVTSLNPAAERILGVNPSEFLGQTSVDREIYAIREDGSSFPGLAQPAMIALHTGRKVQDVVMGVYNLREHSYRWINVSAVPMFRPGENRPYQVYTLFDDITERKYVEIQIRQLNQDLQDRAAALETVNKELEAFAYSVSHDLRAPLRHIDGFLELLQQQIAGTLDDRSRHYMTTISNAAQRMGQLIDDLLAFSRMGRNELVKTPVDLAVLVQEIIREFTPETPGRSIHWRIANLPIVTGDRAMLRLVMVNLLSNALKFTRGRPQAEIEIGCQAGERESIIFIRDNGVGFDMAYAGKLFGVFQRLHQADEFEGTGIGLANVRRIIQRHGGRVWAEGQVGEGAIFYFSLPQAKTLSGLR